jgi:hypothetical protein
MFPLILLHLTALCIFLTANVLTCSFLSVNLVATFPPFQDENFEPIVALIPL